MQKRATLELPLAYQIQTTPSNQPDGPQSQFNIPDRHTPRLVERTIITLIQYLIWIRCIMSSQAF